MPTQEAAIMGSLVPLLANVGNKKEMGLDSVALLMEWEKAFAIDIPNAEAEQIVSVRNATETILRHIHLQPGMVCKSQKLFYAFRHYFTHSFGIELSQFEPGTPLKELLPEKNRRWLWQQMESELSWILPELMHSDLGQEPAAPIKFLGISWTRGQRDTPLTHHTVGEFIGFVLALNYEKLVALPSAANREEVEKVVIGITSDKIGIPIHQIFPESRFTYDLGID
jgi:hypothetical protein